MRSAESFQLAGEFYRKLVFQSSRGAPRVSCTTMDAPFRPFSRSKLEQISNIVNPHRATNFSFPLLPIRQSPRLFDCAVEQLLSSHVPRRAGWVHDEHILDDLFEVDIRSVALREPLVKRRSRFTTPFTNLIGLERALYDIGDRAPFAAREPMGDLPSLGAPHGKLRFRHRKPSPPQMRGYCGAAI